MEASIKIYPNKLKLAEKLALDFSKYVTLLSESKDHVYIAISGGSTPTLFFEAMVKLEPKIDWKKLRFFWVDDRCVPSDHPESNFGVAKKQFLEPLQIPESSYFRIRGEDNPEREAERYSDLILDNVSPDMTFPVFDLVFLGLGTDGHTASIFPHQIDLWNEEKLCTVGTHPDSGQQRVTFTGHLINAASKVVFLVTGSQKSVIANRIIRKIENYTDYPASLVNPHYGELEWYMDEEAAKLFQ